MSACSVISGKNSEYSFVEDEIFDPNVLGIIHSFLPDDKKCNLIKTFPDLEGIGIQLEALQRIRQEHVALTYRRVSVHDQESNSQRSLSLEKLIREAVHMPNHLLLKCVLESRRFSQSRDITILGNALADFSSRGDLIGIKTILKPTLQSTALTRAVTEPKILSRALKVASASSKRKEVSDLLVPVIQEREEQARVSKAKLLGSDKDKNVKLLRSLFKRRKL